MVHRHGPIASVRMNHKPAGRPGPRSRRAQPTARALSDTWHELEGFSEHLDEVAPARVQRVAHKNEIVSALALWWYGRHHDYLVTKGTGRSMKVLAGLSLLSRPRRVVFIEFLPTPRPGFSTVLNRLFIYPLLRRCTAMGQTTTSWEVADFATSVGIRAERLPFVPVAFTADDAKPHSTRSGADSAHPTVFSSGRAACDWQTLFAASTDQPWSLSVVCSARDRPVVEQLGHDHPRVTIRSEISADEHARLLSASDVCVIALAEQNLSSGQLRVGNATAARVPLVATDVRGLDGYVDPGVTALLVPPQDAGAMATAVNRILSDPVLAANLVEAASERAANRTPAEYCNELAELARSLPTPRR